MSEVRVSERLQKRELAACALLACSCVLAVRRYQESFFWVFTRDVTFYPDLVSGLIAGVIMLFIFHRGYLLSPEGSLKYLNWLLLYYFLAVFATIAIGKPGLFSSGRSFFTIVTTPTIFVPLAICCLAFWKHGKFELLAVTSLITFGGSNLLYASKTMGFGGFILAGTFASAAAILLDPRKLRAAWSGNREAKAEDL